MPNRNIEKVVASWTTPYSENVWNRLDELKSDLRVDVDDEQQVDWVVLGPALHDDADPRIASVIVHRHREQGEAPASRMHWTLSVRPVPTVAPPESVREHNDRLGGRMGLITLLADTAPQVGEFRVRLRVEQSDWQCKVLPARVQRGGEHDVAMSLGRSVWLEQVGYRFDGGATGLVELAIVYLHEPQVFMVHIAANGTLKLSSPTWLPYADEIAGLVLSTFFANKEGAS